MTDYHHIEPGYYDSIYRSDRGMRSAMHRLKFAGIGKLLRSFEYHTLLDIACGPGTFISTLPQDKRCTGVDIAPGQIDFARREYASPAHQFLVADIMRMPFDAHSFDVVTMLEFVEHLTTEQHNALFREVRRCLKPGGRILLTTPNYHSEWPLLEFLVSKVTRVDYLQQHITKYTYYTLKERLLQLGFEVVFLSRYLFLSQYAAALNSRIADRLFDFEFGRCNAGISIIAMARKID